MKRILSHQAGIILPTVIAVALILSALGTIIAGQIVQHMRFVEHEQKSLSALNVAEAGINYYLWHLAHNPTDYQDGNSGGSAPYGPYTHSYSDASGNVIGTYTLTITPPATGSTVTTVTSIGKVSGLSGGRTVQAQLGIPSFASYSLLANTEVWFGSGESASGPVHSNVGVHFDGTNNGPVTSANATYRPSASFGGDGAVHNGVWGNGGPVSQWQYPVPTVDFNQITANLQSISTQAQSAGVYLAGSGKLGYYLKLKSNNTVDVYAVKNESSSGITTTFLRNQAAPANGCMFVSDNVWVDGSWGGRMTIAAGRLPDTLSTNTTINVIGNITYPAKDGTAALGLIAQKDVEIAPYAPNILEVDSALLAQKGHVWYASSGPVKTSLSFYGSVASSDFWTWSWVNSGGTITAGFPSSTTTFDTHMTFGPPPCYPTTGSYTILNWRELLTTP